MTSKVDWKLRAPRYLVISANPVARYNRERSNKLDATGISGLVIDNSSVMQLSPAASTLTFGCSRDDQFPCTMVIKRETKLRVARPTDRFDEVVRFYAEGLGLTVLGSFEDHEGFDGVMLGVAGAAYHLEFTRKRGHLVGRAPTEDNLLVFYLPDKQAWQAAVDRMTAAGYQPVPAYNPYWDRDGRTYEDPDGYRVVLQNANWSA